MTVATMPDVGELHARCAAIVPTIDPDASVRLHRILMALLSADLGLTTIRDPYEAIERHILDSLVALAVPQVAAARTAVDVGSGNGFPGIALAAARPCLAMTLVESKARKARWLAAIAADLPNVRVVADRSEHLAATEREQVELVTARALGPLPVSLELAAPLVAVAGAIVIWRASRDPSAEHAAAAAATELGLGRAEVIPVAPFAGAQRHLHVYVKRAPTDARFPRRPGRAAKRPLA